MKVFKGSAQVKGLSLTSPVVTLGNFDGIHLGHQKIFKKATKRARTIGGVSIVYTFHPHPVTILAPQKPLLSITTLEEKIRLIETLGIDILICEHFNKRFSMMSPEKFIEHILCTRIHPSEVFVGHDYAFGKDRKGSITLLKTMGKTLHYKVRVIDNISINNTPVRSTTIRNLIQSGKVRDANKLLGRAYSISGKVVKGEKRRIGFPTANLKPEKNLIPKKGVYAINIQTPSGTFPGVVNIGFNPTFEGKKLTIEAHILDFHKNLYGKKITLFFIERLRGEKKFRSVRALTTQIENDIQKAREILKKK